MSAAPKPHLERELSMYRPAWYRASRRVGELEQRLEKLAAENMLLKQRVKELTLAAGVRRGAQAAAAVVKPSVNPV